MKCYDERNRLLRIIGFKTYRAYLDSDRWAKIRSKKLSRDENCFGCGREATQVHHGKYTLLNLLGESDEHLFSVCGGCHFKSEFDVSGQKNTVKTAMKKLRKISARMTWTPSKLIGAAFYAKDRTPNVDDEFKQRVERES